MPATDAQKLDQRRSALERANDVRCGRAQIKKEIRDKIISVCDIIETRPDIMDDYTLGRLFMQQKGWGKERVRKFFMWKPRLEKTKVKNLTDRERKIVCDRWYEKEGYTI